MFDDEILEPKPIEGDADGGGGMTPLGPIAEGQSMVRMAGSYATAVKVAKPREIDKVRRNLLDEARLMGEAAYYGWGAGKDRVEGPSQALAYSLARLWGNCAIELGPVQETSDAWIFTAYVIDLETGTTVPRQFRQSKRWKVYGKHNAERKEDIRFQIGQSKAIRNAVLKALPDWLVDQALDAAKAGVRERIERYIEKNGKAKAIEVALGELAKHGVAEEVVCGRYGVAKPEGLTIENLVTIKGDLKAIQDGEASAHELYPTGATEGVSAEEIVGKGKKEGAEKEAKEKTEPEGEGAGEPAAAEATAGDEEEPKEPYVELSPSAWSRLERQAEEAGIQRQEWAAILARHTPDPHTVPPASAETDLLRVIEERGRKR